MGLMLVLGLDWAKMQLIGPSSGSLLSPSTYVSVTIIKRNREGREWKGGSREKLKEGKREADC